MMSELFSFSNVVFSTFAFHSSVVILKTCFIAIYTSLTRARKGAFATPEDVSSFYFGRDKKERKPIQNDPDVERVRKNHLNDLENIPFFVLLGGIYVLTNPDPVTAIWHFRAFAASRILHTLSYQMGLQPWRAIFFFVGFGVNISMAVQILMMGTH